MNSTKKLTEASILTSLFIVSTIAFVSIGFGYALYLDFIVPVFFTIVLLKCDFKYSVLSGVVSVIIIGLILGNIGTAIWISQSILLGIMCGVLMKKDTTVIDDLLYGSVLGVIFMVFIDIYASKLIGYSFMKEFEGYIKIFSNKDYASILYYLFIALFPFGTVFCIYYLSLILSRKLNISRGKSKEKTEIIQRFKYLSRYLCCSKYVFYGCSIYIIFIEILYNININIEIVYINTILISIKYLCIYFVIRDGYIVVQNHILYKYNKILYVRILSIIIFILLIFLFKITICCLIVYNVVLDVKFNIRTNYIKIIKNYITTN